MSAAHRPGGPSRRAMVRWSWRMFRKEWRQQLLVLGLMTIAVAGSVAGSTMAMNASTHSQTEFGTASALSRVEVDGPDRAEAALAAAEARYGTVEVIGHSFVPVPGVPLPLDLRAQDPDGRFGHTQLRLLDGRYPTTAHEVAITPGIADVLHLGVGDDLGLTRSSRRIVGLVENPSALSDQFALEPADRWSAATSLTLLFDRPGTAGSSARTGAEADVPPGQIALPVMVRGSNGPVAALVLVAVALALTLVGLIAAAAFVVLAQRRQRQLGLLAAIGATPRQLRTVVLAHGALVGMIAAVVGGVLGLAAWVAAAPAVEQAAGRRIDRFDLPWGVLAGCLLLAVATAVAAAWWPARRVARIPVIAALSGRPPRPTPVHRSSLLAGALVLGGAGAIRVAVPGGERVVPPLLLAGVVAIALGTVAFAPAAIRLAAAPARTFPLPSRIAVRDLARFQARAASTLAAIAFAVGLCVTITAIAQASEFGADEGNLPADQLLIRPGDGMTTAAGTADLDAAAAAVADTIRGGSTLTLDEAVPSRPADGPAETVEPISQSLQVGPGSWRGLGTVIVATPELLRAYGIDPDDVRADTDLLTSDDRAVELLDTSRRAGPETTRVQHVDLPRYFAAPHALVTEHAMAEHGWERRRQGWLVTAPDDLTTDQIETARAAAARRGLTVETRISQDSLATFRTTVSIVGLLLGLAIVAMTVGLIRSESSRDLRTLTATGASSRSRRGITASTAGVLALLGVALGVGGAYLALLAGYHSDLAQLVPLPWPELAAIVVGLPVLATATGWVLAGREPRGFSRQTFD